MGTEGAIAKLIATEAGLASAEAAIQAMGGYGYTKEYVVERIRRDVRITTIYEGTSEIMEWTIARDRWRSHLQTRGQYYAQMAPALDELHASAPAVGADSAAQALRALNYLLERARAERLTRNQHILFRLGEWIALAETAAAMCRYAANPATKVSGLDAQTVQAVSRIYAREAAMRIVTEGLRWIHGAAPLDDAGFAELERAINAGAIYRAQGGILSDMDQVAEALRQLEP